jgi:hypothetical protein
MGENAAAVKYGLQKLPADKSTLPERKSAL